jgi:hypothetical protein
MKCAEIQLISDLLREFSRKYQYSERIEPLEFTFHEDNEGFYCRVNTWTALSIGINVKGRSIGEAVSNFIQELEYRIATLSKCGTNFHSFFDRLSHEDRSRAFEDRL